jgi:hypothetical protein
MNTETQLARRSNNAIASIRTSALIALFALASAVALADQQPVPATRAAKVSLVGLDISTFRIPDQQALALQVPAGPRADPLYQRLKLLPIRRAYRLRYAG